jgi:hypothetical protein
MGITVHNQAEISAVGGFTGVLYLRTFLACTCNWQAYTIGNELPQGSFTPNSNNYAGRSLVSSTFPGLVGTFYQDTNEFKYKDTTGTVQTLTTGDSFDMLVCNHNPESILINQISVYVQNITQLINTLSSQAPLTEQCLIDVQTEAVELNDTMVTVIDFSDVFICTDYLDFLPEFINGLEETYVDYEICLNSLTTTTQEVTTTTAGTYF